MVLTTRVKGVILMEGEGLDAESEDMNMEVIQL
jgi:hypothetical protein